MILLFLALYLTAAISAVIWQHSLFRFRAVYAFGLGLFQWIIIYTIANSLESIQWENIHFFQNSFPFIEMNEVTGIALALLCFIILTAFWYVFEKRHSFNLGISAIKVLFALVISTAVPVYICIAYNADFASPIFLAGYICINLLLYIRYVWKPHYVLTILLFIFTTALAVTSYTGIVITPLSAFLAWFDMLKEQGAGGLIPMLFAVTGGVFTSILGGISYRHGYKGPILGALFVLAVLLAVIHQSIIFIIVSVILLFLAVFHLAGLGNKKKLTAKFQAVVFICILSMIIAIPFSAIYKAKGSAFIDGYISPVLKNTTVAMFPNFPFLYSIEGYGYSFNQRRLGGKPALSKRAVFTVEAPRNTTMYLRTEIFDVYTGKGWLQSAGIVDDAKNNPISQTFIPWQSISAYEKKCEITIQTDFYDRLPHTLDAQMFFSNKGRIRTLQTADASIGFVPKKPLVRNDRIAVYKTPELALELRYKDKYLAVPPDIPQEVVSLAARLGSGIENEPGKILSNIETYLAQNYTYSLEVSYIPPEAIDASWDFLFNSTTGYCTHFATAYILLARLNGIPARYVSGFLVYMPSDRDSTVVTGLSAHAWPEVWLPESGWQTKEATPPMNPELQQQFLYYGNYLTGQSFTSQQLEAILENTGVTFTKDEEDKPFDIPYVLVVFVIAGVVVALLIIYVPRLLRVLPSSDHNEQMKRLLKRVVKYYKFYGFEPPRNGGWTAWSIRINEARPDQSKQIQRICNISKHLYYGPEGYRSLDKKYLKLFIRRGFK